MPAGHEDHRRRRVPRHAGGGLNTAAPPGGGKLAINRLAQRDVRDPGVVDRFLERHDFPIVEGSRCTFVFRGEADEVHVTHRIVGIPERLPLARVDGTDLWYLVFELPAGSRVEYRLEVRRGDHVESIEDPLNPKRSHNPFGSNSVCYATGYQVPDWTQPDSEARPGVLDRITVASRALGTEVALNVYLPARFRRTARYPLLVLHDGSEFLQFAAAKTVLDNLIHRLDVAELVVAFVDPVSDRLVEYADHAPHARFVATELVPALESQLPLVDKASARGLAGSSFGAVATLSTAVRFPRTYGSLMLQSGSFLFTDIGTDHGGGPVFDPVVKFVNRYRARPKRVADRVFSSCGVYEPLIVQNRAMVPTFEQTGMQVRFVESRDGHNWESWRDRLRDGLSWLFPGPHKLYYE